MTATFDFDYLDAEAMNKLKELGFSKKGSKRLCFHKNKDSDLVDPAAHKSSNY